jgi:hypothetical protein
MDIKYQPAAVVNHQVSALGVEQYALMVLEANAYRRGLEAGLDVIVEEHQKLVAPEEIRGGLEATEEDNIDEQLY